MATCSLCDLGHVHHLSEFQFLHLKKENKKLASQAGSKHKMRWCYVSGVAPGTRLLPLCLHLSLQDVDVNIVKLGSGPGAWGCH